MNKIFNDVSVAGILVPGQVYILSESQSSLAPLESIEELFVIKREAEILISLDMMYGQMFAEDYELVEFLGIRKINDDCHEFRILCWDRKFKKNVERSQYVNRIRSFEEFVFEMETDYGNGN